MTDSTAGADRNACTAAWKEQLVRFGFEFRVVIFDERPDIVSHIEEPSPLLLVKRDGKASESIDGHAALFADLQRYAPRRAILEPFVLRAQPVEFCLQIIV